MKNRNSRIRTRSLLIRCFLSGFYHSSKESAFLRHQAAWGVKLDELSVLQDEQQIAVHDGVDPVGDDEECLVVLRDKRVQRILYQRVGAPVHVGRGLVQRHDLGIREENSVEEHRCEGTDGGPKGDHLARQRSWRCPTLRLPPFSEMRASSPPMSVATVSRQTF